MCRQQGKGGEALEELYEVYGQLVYRFLLSACRDEALAEDLTQDTFLQAFQSLERFRGECRISTWLCQIARHLYWQHLEKQGGRVPETLDESLPASENTETQAFRRIELAEVLERLEGLPPLMRQTVYLRALEGLPFKEIGGILGKSENWARVTFYRAKEKLIQEAGHEEA